MLFNVCYISLMFYLITSSNGLKPRIFGGDELQSQKHLVLLNIYTEQNELIKCSGSIIKPSYIISSAHCFENPTRYVDVKHMTEGEVVNIAKVEGKNIKTHENYLKEDENSTDLAILRTTKRIQFNKAVRPIKLYKDVFKVDQSQTAFIAGFGEHDEGEAGKIMTGGKVVVYRCPETTETAICSKDGVVAADGDSGGSLVSRNRLLGVTSAIAGCLEGVPCVTIYASIPANMKWILRNIRDRLN